MSAERAAAIKDIYQPLHTHVYHLKVLSAPASANNVIYNVPDCSLRHICTPPLLRRPTLLQSSRRLLSIVKAAAPAQKVS